MENITTGHWIFAGSEKCSSDSITVIRIGIYHEEIDDWVWDKDNDLRSHIDDILEILYDGESGSTPLISSSADNTVKFWKIMFLISISINKVINTIVEDLFIFLIK